MSDYTTERALRRDLRKYLESLGFLVRPYHSGPYTSPGWPDIECWSKKGINLHVEAKRPGQKLSWRQTKRICEMRDRGIHVCVATETDDVLSYLKKEKIDHAPRKNKQTKRTKAVKNLGSVADIRKQNKKKRTD